MMKMDPKIANWLISGDTGRSSQNILIYMSSGVTSKEWHAISPPSDPDDLGRCLRLLNIFPEWKPRMAEMAALGGLWPVFAERWDEIAKAMEDEVGADWSKGKHAPKTYALMKSIQKQAQAKRTDGVKSFSFGSGATVSYTV